MADRICRLLDGMDIRRDVPLSQLTSFRIGGPAALTARPRNADELRSVLHICADLRYPLCVLGNGTNVLAPDAGFDGMIVQMNLPITSPIYIDTLVTCPAGTLLSVLARDSVHNGLMGMEALSGIPGTVGGAVAMNAGAYGGEIRYIIESVRVMYPDGSTADVRCGHADFGYRRSAFCAPETVVLSASFRLRRDDGGAKARMNEYTDQRKRKQPLSLPSAGSVFKRPSGRFAGALIEEAGMKGASVGGAQVSPLHAGFIVNNGGATERDVRELIRLVQERVYETSGVMLERELKLLSEV